MASCPSCLFFEGFAHTFTVHGTVPEVFRAWTDAIELQRWFAEHVAIEAREGGIFRFWGRHTYGAPGEKDATGRIVRHQPNTAMAFEYQRKRKSDVSARSASVGWIRKARRAGTRHASRVTPRMNAAIATTAAGIISGPASAIPLG